jgi:hypothetical protein
MMRVEIEESDPHIALYSLYKALYPHNRKYTEPVIVKINHPVWAEREEMMFKRLEQAYTASLAEPGFWQKGLDYVKEHFLNHVAIHVRYDTTRFVSTGRVIKRIHLWCMIDVLKSEYLPMIMSELVQGYIRQHKMLNRKVKSGVAHGNVRIIIASLYHKSIKCVDMRKREIFKYAMEDIDDKLITKNNRITSPLERKELIVRWKLYRMKVAPNQKFKNWRFYAKKLDDYERFIDLEYEPTPYFFVPQGGGRSKVIFLLKDGRISTTKPLDDAEKRMNTITGE